MTQASVTRIPASLAEKATLGFMAIAGLVLAAAPGKITNALAKRLPLAFTVESGGTHFGPFHDIGSTELRRLGLALMIGAATAIILRRRPIARRALRPESPLEGGVRRVAIFAVAFAVFYYLGSPHNAFSTNSRIHWVDFTSWDSDNFFYAAGHLPHTIFYRHPPLWQGLNAGLLAVAMDHLLRRLGWSRVSAAVLTFAFLMSSTVLLFADTAEDVLLNFLLLVALMCALLTHRSWLRGMAFAGAVLGRPEFLALIGVYAVAVALMAAYDRFARPGRRWPQRGSFAFHLRVVGWAIGFIALSQVVFTILGTRYIFSHGRVLYLAQLQDLEPILTHDYLISRFGGAYIGHALWILPFTMIATIGAGAIFAIRHRDEDPLDTRRVFALFCVGASAAVVVLHEAKPLIYYNVRYLSYALPFLYVAALIAVQKIRRYSPTVATALLVASVLNLFALPVNPLTVKHRVEKRVELQLFDHLDEAQDALDGRRLLVSFGGLTSRNGIAYVFHTALANIEPASVDDLRKRLVAHDPTLTTYLIVAKCNDVNDLVSGYPVVVRTADLCVIRPG